MDAVTTLRRDIAALRPGDEREAASQERILVELAGLPRPFDEHADPVHVTASAILVGPRGTLLHLHKRLGLWLQPGGHIAPDETPAEAAVREVREETGLVVRHPAEGPLLVHVDVHPGPRGHTHLDLRYLFATADTPPSPGAGESQQVRWFTWEDAAAVADPGLVGALRKVRGRCRRASAAGWVRDGRVDGWSVVVCAPQAADSPFGDGDAKDEHAAAGEHVPRQRLAEHRDAEQHGDERQ